MHFFFKEKVYTYYIYILTYLRLFYFLVFLVLCLLCSSPQVFFACLYRAALLLHACVFTEGSSNSLDPSTVRRELCHGNVHIGDGGTTAILQQGVFFNAVRLFRAVLFFLPGHFRNKMFENCHSCIIYIALDSLGSAQLAKL